MPVRRNSYYQTDPAIAKGMENIASMFAPPSAQDIAAGATAAATREKAERAAALFQYAQSPEFKKEMLDRLAIANGTYSPNQSYYSVDLGDQTTRRGQDVSAAAQRYGADRTYAATTRGQDVTADTTRRGQDVTARTTLASQFFGPLKQGETQREIPAEITAPLGLPVPVAAASGLAPNLTDSQVIGAITQTLPANEQRAIAMKDVKPTEIMRDGKRVYANAADAAGAEVPIDPTKEALTTAIGPDGGRLGPAVMRNGKLVNPQTGAEYPADVASATLSVQAATPGALGGKTTEDQRKAGYAYDMTDAATTDILKAFDTPGGLPTATDNVIRGVADKLPGALRGPVNNMMSEPGQVFLQNVRTALPMQLLTQSGMGVTEGEYERKMQELVPVAGEAPKVTQDKRRQFETYREAVKRMAGPAIAPAPGAATPPQDRAGGVPTPPPPASGPQPAPKAERWERVNGKLVKVQ